MTPNPVYENILEQPAFLRQLIAYYSTPEGQSRLVSTANLNPHFLTGMGSSYHAALYLQFILQSRGRPCLALEAADLLHYTTAPPDGRSLLYISQSGRSGEIDPLLQRGVGKNGLGVMTNETGSPLALAADVCLPLVAGSEPLVATKTYLNSLGVAFLLAHTIINGSTVSALDRLACLASQLEALLKDAQEIGRQWAQSADGIQRLAYVGHGPHAVTARQAALMTAEWAKQPALYTSVAAFRHGFIEIVQPDALVVIFTDQGSSFDSAIHLARDVQAYGGRALLVCQGMLCDPLKNTQTTAPIDPYLQVLLDIVPAQLFVDAWARELGVPPDFRYIQKVTTTL